MAEARDLDGMADRAVGQASDLIVALLGGVADGSMPADQAAQHARETIATFRVLFDALKTRLKQSEAERQALAEQNGRLIDTIEELRYRLDSGN